jgi:transposase InsO family protein
VEDLHAQGLGGHMGAQTLFPQLVNLCYWKGMKPFIERCIQNCVLCASTKARPQYVSEWRSIRAQRPGLRLIWDIVTIAPGGKVEGIDIKDVLSVVCAYTRYCWFLPLVNVKAETIAQALFHIVLDAGVIPIYLQSDRGKNLLSEVTAELAAMLGTTLRWSSPYHPQSQGMVEQISNSFGISGCS